jgi:linearmycin/streptolysin S transport system permease protein
MRSVIALALKDLRILVRVRSGLFFTFVWPVIVAVMFGVVFAGQGQGGPSPLRVVVVDEDKTAESREYIARLVASGDFAVEEGTRAEAENVVRRGQRSAFAVIKPGFGNGSRRMFYGAARQIELGSDPSRAAEAGMIEGLLTRYAMEDMRKLFTQPNESKKMISEALGNINAAPGNASSLAPLKKFLGELDTFLTSPLPPGPDGQGAAAWQPLQIAKVPVTRTERRGPANAFQVTFPQGVVWGIIGCVMSFAIGLVSERVRGTYVRLRMAPLSRTQVLGGKAAACFLSISILQIMILSLGAIFFDVRPAALPLLVLACVCASAGFVGFMMMISSLGKTEQAVAGAGWAMLMPMAMLGGAMIPQFVMPARMLAVANVSPIKWALLGIEGALWRGFTLAEMALPCLVLLGFGAICFAVGVRGLREA